MKIIAIEGLDKSGKDTATNVLYNYLQEKGLTVERMSFPNYDTPMGVLIRQWLKGEFEADASVFELLQAADKQHAQRAIQEFENRGVDVLLIDRYIHTMWAYGVYDNDADWVHELSRGIRLPDTVLYMDVEPEVSMHRRGKFGDNDKYESDLNRLRAASLEFKRLLGHNNTIETYTIDANQPQPIVQAHVKFFAFEQYNALIDGVNNIAHV